jgi:hypothetical protein
MKKLLMLICLSVLCFGAYEIKPKESKIDGTSIYVYEFTSKDGKNCIVVSKQRTVSIYCYDVKGK